MNTRSEEIIAARAEREKEWAYGLFLYAVEQRVAENLVTFLGLAGASQIPTVEPCTASAIQKELFSGDLEKTANAFYNKGQDDVSRGRNRLKAEQTTLVLPESGQTTTITFSEGSFTDASLFYLQVQKLVVASARVYDVPRQGA